MSWYLQYQQTPWPEKLQAHFNRKYASWFTNPGDAGSEVIYRLLYKRLPATEIQHQNNLNAFVYAALRFVVLDVKRETDGRAYYPLEIEEHGEPIKSIYESYCFEAKTARTIAAELCLLLAFVRECIARIEAKRWCRERKLHVSLDDEALHADSGLTTPADQIRQMDSINLNKAETLYEWWRDGVQGDRAVATSIGSELVEKLRQNPPPSLTDQERKLLKLVSIEGKTHQQAGEILDIPASTVGDRKLAIIKRFRTYLVELGLIDS